jgi:succinylglutamate desuccinylase
MLLKQLETLPDELITVSASDLWRVLPEPTLIHLPGRHPAPLFVSVLLHGHETTGFLAIQALLAKYRSAQLPRALSIFFGNIEAARHVARRLDGQLDYNRVWPGSDVAECAETRRCREVLDVMARRGVFASVDVHNNTGTNPHYACVNRLDPPFLQLASLFGRLVIYFTYPKGTQTAAFAALCPAVTLECGKPDQVYGVTHALEYLDACLHLTDIPQHPVAAHDIDLFHSVAQVTIPPEVHFGFSPGRWDLTLDEGIDRLNFTELPAGVPLGELREGGIEWPVRVRSPAGHDVTERYFERNGTQLTTRIPLMPSMLTLDERIIRQDCLCYLMERMSV